MFNAFSRVTFLLLIAAVGLFFANYATAQCAIHGTPVYVQPVYHPPVAVNRVQTQTVVTAPQPNVSPEMRQAKNKVDVARAYFKTDQYADAQRHLDVVVKMVPDETNAFQFRSLVMFAQGKYDDAAADAYDAIGLGNTWTAEVLDSIYPDADRYHRQLASLKHAADANPSMPTHFLLAYHYLILNDLENGRAQLEQVLVLQPEEPLTTQLLAAVSAKLNPVIESNSESIAESAVETAAVDN
jgi:predicted Zn-dependent protease